MKNNFFPKPEDLNSGEHFPALKKLVDEKLMQVVLFTGPPRCGTTATGKFGHQALGAHVNINQPGMFSRAGHMSSKSGLSQQFLLSGRDRNAEIWRRVYDQVFYIHNSFRRAGFIPSEDTPIVLSAKETTHLILFDREVEQWRSLVSDRILMSIRDPLLQMRSAMLMILDNIDTDIFSKRVELQDYGGFEQTPVYNSGFDMDKNQDVRRFSVHGHPFLNSERLNAALESGNLSEHTSENYAGQMSILI